MATIGTERVLTVHHWNETVFSFTTTRDQALRFENGHFIMLGLRIEDKPVMRAYSIASANHEDHLEFLSIKVPDGPLTSRLQHLRPGDSILISQKPTGTLLVHGVRWARETAVAEHFIADLRAHEVLGELVQDKLHYHPTITREPHTNH